MRDKGWKDCPSCGSIDSMKQSNSMVFKVDKFGIDLSGLSGYECSVCHDGILSSASSELLESHIKMARTNLNKTQDYC